MVLMIGTTHMFPVAHKKPEKSNGSKYIFDENPNFMATYLQALQEDRT